MLLLLLLGHRLRSQTWLPIADQHRHVEPLGGGSNLVLLLLQVMTGKARRLLRLGALRFVPMVLEPDFDLRRRQIDHAGQMFPFRGRQVPGLLEPSLQLVSLRFVEQNPALALLLPGLATSPGTVTTRSFVPGIADLDAIVQRFSVARGMTVVVVVVAIGAAATVQGGRKSVRLFDNRRRDVVVGSAEGGGGVRR